MKRTEGAPLLAVAASALALALALLSLLATTAPVFAKSGSASFKEAAETYTAATEAGDADRIAALYAPNSVLLVPGLAPIVGPAAIKGHFQRVFALGKNRIAFGLIRAETGSDRAGVYWEWTSEIALENGTKRTMRGRSFVYFRKDNDSWLINFDTMQVRPAP